MGFAETQNRSMILESIEVIWLSEVEIVGQCIPKKT